MKIQTGMPLVVLTYPGHFLLTALTIQSYFKHHTQVPVTVLVDDLSKLCWPDYVNNCQELYQGCDILPLSTTTLDLSNWHPWIRQQLVKLHLDQIVPHDEWFFTDGDVEYHFPAPSNSIPFSITRGGLIQEQQNNYAALFLGIDNPGIWTEHKDMDWVPGTFYHQVCVSNPPFRSMSAKVLQALRTHAESLHNQSVIDMHRDLNNVDYAVSEWELIANFQLHVLKDSTPVVYYPTVPIERELEFFPDQPDFCGTCFCSDSGFDRAWWQSKGINISDQIWQHIVNIAK